MVQSQISFESGGKTIRLDCFLPDNCTQRLPTVIALYGFGGDTSSMGDSSGQLADQGFAVYVLHFFDRTGRVEAEKSAIVMNFPLWMKTLWDGVSCVEQQAYVDTQRIGLVGFLGVLFVAIRLLYAPTTFCIVAPAVMHTPYIWSGAAIPSKCKPSRSTSA